MNDQDLYFMELAIKEAEKGVGRTSPNPAVGAIIVRDDLVVGRGYHKKAGTPHAEVNAIQDAGNATENATIYVTLEPCNHTGRTPPCTQAIIQSKIKRVVIGMLDPNPHVAGNGVQRLEENDIEVVSGLLDQRCRALNYPFIKHITSGRPWVAMKAGLSLDARISYMKGQGGKITGTAAHQHVHHLRNTYDAILIGIGTALIDDPSLTTRLNQQDTRDPIRVIIDSQLRLPETSRILRQKSESNTLLYCTTAASTTKQEALENLGAEIVRVAGDRHGHVSLAAVIENLGKRNITSVLVEGGKAIHGAMLNNDLVDQLYLYYAPFFIGDQGTPLLEGYSVDCRDKANQYRIVNGTQLGKDFLLTALTEKASKLAGY